MTTPHKPYPVLCRDCKYSVWQKGSEWNVRCANPAVNGNDPWYLSSASSEGADCKSEREGNWFNSKCGMRGALWIAKEST